MDLEAIQQGRNELVSTLGWLDQTEKILMKQLTESLEEKKRRHNLNTTHLHHENKMVGQLLELRCTNTVRVGVRSVTLVKRMVT